jgi:hypothetical protein
MRYIELDKAIKVACEFVGKLTHNQIDAVDMAVALEELPTEDVVPRSEVEKFIQEIDQIQKDKAEITYLKEQLIAKAKQEVAREIFEEIEKEIKEAMNFVKQNYAETENALWQAQYVGLNQARYIVLDAKKKYIKIQ